MRAFSFRRRTFGGSYGRKFSVPEEMPLKSWRLKENLSLRP
jgi:hypothetical protein